MARKALAIKEQDEIKREEEVRLPAKGKKRTHETAETMAARQRDISVSEFFAKTGICWDLTIPRNLC